MTNNANTLLRYNKLLKRQKKAELYLDNPGIKMEIIVCKYLPEYQRIVKKLSALMLLVPNATKDEILNGFEIIGGIDL